MDTLSGSSEYNSTIPIGQGDQATIELDPRSNLVRKTFVSEDNSLTERQLDWEFNHLSAYSKALADFPFITCPEPVSVEPQSSSFWMTYCSGQRLDQALADGDTATEQHLDHIANQIALALEVYIQVFNEPYFDFTTANMLYDSSTRVLSLVDLSDPEIYLKHEFHDADIDLSVGNFISSTTYHTLRPRVLWNLGYWRRQKKLTLSVVQALGSRFRLNANVIRRVQAVKYNAHANHGSKLRRTWFLSMGKLLYWWRVTSIIDTLEG